jgi:hypothetical protein
MVCDAIQALLGASDGGGFSKYDLESNESLIDKSLDGTLSKIEEDSVYEFLSRYKSLEDTLCLHSCLYIIYFCLLLTNLA